MKETCQQGLGWLQVCNRINHAFLTEEKKIVLKTQVQNPVAKFKYEAFFW